MTERELYDSIVGDFEGAWRALSELDAPVGRGNFMFARQAVVLLEWASRLVCPNGVPGPHHGAFSDALHALQPRYFGALPGAVPKPKGFWLPFVGSDPRRHLLWGIFDLIRNGGAHQYQQIHVTLADGRNFGISIANGADLGHTLGQPRRRREHLAFNRQWNGLWMVVCPDELFLDIRDAIAEAHLLESGLTFAYLKRGVTGGNATRSQVEWAFTSVDLALAFKENGQVDLA